MIDASLMRKKARTPRQLERAMRPKEHHVQAAFVIWLRYEEKFYPALQTMFAVPNGGHRSGKTAKAMQQEGQRPGVPDMMLPAPRQGCTGLAIEFKRPDEGLDKALSKAQREYRPKLEAEGWKYAVVDDFEDAIAITKAYLGIK